MDIRNNVAACINRSMIKVEEPFRLSITYHVATLGLEVAPVIKVSTNSSLGKRWHDLIDMDAGRIANKEITLEEPGWELFHLILDVASGRKQAAADRLGLHNDLVLFNPAPVT